MNYLSSKDRFKLNFSDLLAISVLFVYLFRVPFYIRKRSREWKKFKKRCWIYVYTRLGQTLFEIKINNKTFGESVVLTNPILCGDQIIFHFDQLYRTNNLDLGINLNVEYCVLRTT